MVAGMQLVASRVTNSVTGAVARGYVEPPESIGSPADAPATAVTDRVSLFALAKGILAALGVSAGDGTAVLAPHPQAYFDPLASLGKPDDAAAGDSQPHSAIALLKGILARAGV